MNDAPYDMPSDLKQTAKSHSQAEIIAKSYVVIHMLKNIWATVKRTALVRIDKGQPGRGKFQLEEVTHFLSASSFKYEL